MINDNEIFNRKKEIKELINIINKNEYIFIEGESGVGKSILIKYILECKIRKKYLSISFKEFENKEEFFSVINLLYSIHNDLIIEKVKALNDEIGFIEFKELLQTIKDIKNSYLPENFRLFLKNKGYVEFFQKFWEVLDDKIEVIWFSNLELLIDNDILEFIKAMILTKNSTTKIIFEKGNLINNYIFEKIQNFINYNKEISHFYLKPFDLEHSKKFCEEFLKEEYCESIFNISKGIPLKIKYKNHIEKIINNEYTNSEEQFLILLTILYEFEDDYDFIIDILVDKLEITDVDFTSEKFKFIEIEPDKKIKITHYYIYLTLRNKFALKIKKFIENLSFLKEENIELYYKILVKFNKKLIEKEIIDFIKFLSEKLEEFKIIELDSYLSFKIQNKNDFYKEILSLIQKQVKIYSFQNISSLELSNSELKVIDFILDLQKLYHEDKFEEVINKIKQHLSNYILLLDDQKIQDYLIFTLNALEGVSLLALGKYGEARNMLTSVIINEKIKNFNNLYHYILNLLPAIEFENALNNKEFTDVNNIKNKYIQLKRRHNIAAVELYDINKLKKLENTLKTIIEGFKSIGSIELSYTKNNLLVHYIFTKKNKLAEEIIENIEYIWFERYDKISLYNNALVYFMQQRKFDKGEEYLNKALEVIEKGFNDPSFISKVYLNGAILKKMKNENYIYLLDKVKKTIPEDYDDYYLLMEKIEFIKNHNIPDNFIFKKEEEDILEKYIFWPQIIHFWDFDIPLLNKEIIQYLINQKNT